MCDPVSLAVVSIGTMVLGGVMQYKAAGQAQKLSNQVSEQNQKTRELQAVDAERLGELEAGEARMKTRQLLAQQVTGFAAQNVALTGTPLDILGDTAMFGKIDEDRIRANAQRRAWGYRMEGYNIGAQNQLDRFQTKVNQTGTILSTAGGVAGAWGNYLNTKPTTAPASNSYTPTGYGSTWGTGRGLAAAGYP